MIDAFIFDLDGVITDTAEYHYLAWKELANKIGIEIDREFNETLKGVSRLESLERILVHGNKQNDFTIEEKEKMAKSKAEWQANFDSQFKIVAKIASDHNATITWCGTNNAERGDQWMVSQNNEQLGVFTV